MLLSLSPTKIFLISSLTLRLSNCYLIIKYWGDMLDTSLLFKSILISSWSANTFYIVLIPLKSLILVLLPSMWSILVKKLEPWKRQSILPLFRIVFYKYQLSCQLVDSVVQVSRALLIFCLLFFINYWSLPIVSFVSFWFMYF